MGSLYREPGCFDRSKAHAVVRLLFGGGTPPPVLCRQSLRRNGLRSGLGLQPRFDCWSALVRLWLGSRVWLSRGRVLGSGLDESTALGVVCLAVV